MRRLSTHVLDTVAGGPARGMTIELFAVEGETRRLITTRQTNADGRTDAPMLAGDDYRPGTYELRFHVAAHFAATGAAKGDLPFLDIVPIRFTIAEPDSHYHVPLLVTPWSYSTYRGS